jgi:ABC-type multidrug transport system fused ATPase/permease subunit
MPSQVESRGEPGASLAALGTGGRDDRLDFRLVVGLLWRCVHLLRPVRRHVAALFAAFVGLALLFLPLGVLLFDSFWTRALQGEPLLDLEAAVLGLDPATSVTVERLSPELRRQVLLRTVLVGGVAALVVTPVAMALYYYQVWILQRVNQQLRVSLLEKLQALSLRFHADNRVGDAIYRMVQDSAMVTQLIELLFLTPVYTVARYLFSIGVVALFDPLLALVLAGLIPPFLLLGLWFSRRLRVRFRRAREAASSLTSSIQETLAGIRVVKAYGAEAAEQRRFEDASSAAFAAAFDARSLLAAFLVLLFQVTGVALALAGAWAALRTRTGDDIAVAAMGFTVWNLGLFNYAKTRFGDGAGQLRALFRTWGRTQDVAIGLERVFDVLDLEPEVRDAPGAAPLPRPRRGVRFRDVAFRYDPARPALEGVDFEARVGSVVAVVGPTGSGKTTLMSLLLRLFEPDRGAVEVDGIDVRHVQVESLRHHVAVALQENLLFGTTIRENIRYAVPDASDAAVREAARVACADEFIERQPEGYDTPLGERGTKLSTGQRQRLSIARAVLKDPAILILDEPTASLDAETELRVLENLAAWGRGRLVFLITHRLSTVRRADHIVVLEDGRLVEAGSHAELLARAGGRYRALVEREAGAPPPERAGAGHTPEAAAHRRGAAR